VVPTYQQELAKATGPADKRPAEYAALYLASADPNSYMTFLGSWNTKQGEFNLTDYAPPALDGLINAGVASSDHATRFGTYSDILKTSSLDVPYVPLFIGESLIALAKTFSCPQRSAYFGVDYPWARSIKPAGA
jgi:ABC-type transport system substrate-binding protein